MFFYVRAAHFANWISRCTLVPMIITYHGGEFVKLQAGDTVLGFNPISKESKLKSTTFGADICFVSLNHPDMNGIENCSRKERQAFVIRGPGEYEVSSVFAAGYGTKSHYDEVEWFNTVYALQFDGMQVVYLGALDEGKLPSEVTEDIDEIDVLFVPIGGFGVLDAAQAHKIAVQLEPKVIIPIHFGDVGEKDALKRFLKESGAEGVKPVDKLTIKPKDIAGKKGEVVVLSA